jgi:hypothetical protein
MKTFASKRWSWVALPLLAALNGCVVSSLSAQLPPASPNPFEGAAGTELKLPQTAGRWQDTPPGFGPYQVSDLHRGWTRVRSYASQPLYPGATGSPVLDLFSLPYVQHLTTTRRRSRFHFADDQGHTADVYTTTEGVTKALTIMPGLNEVQRATETFSAVIVGPQLGRTNAWRLLLNLPDYLHQPTLDPTADVGLVGDEEQVLLHIKRIPHPSFTMPNGRRVPWPVLAAPGGLEVLCQQQRVAYIDYATAHPSVWLRNDLPPDLRFLTATTLSAVLLKSGW